MSATAKRVPSWLLHCREREREMGIKGEEIWRVMCAIGRGEGRGSCSVRQAAGGAALLLIWGKDRRGFKPAVGRPGETSQHTQLRLHFSGLWRGRLPKSPHCSYVEIIGFVAMQGTDDSEVNKLHPVSPSSKMTKQTDCSFSCEWTPRLWTVIIQGQLFNILATQKL